MSVRLAVPALVVFSVTCGQMAPGGSTSGMDLPQGSPPPSSSNGAECSELASIYLGALREATRCTPGAVSRCTVQRPLVHAVAGASRPDGLCWVAYMGMLEPERASTLDPLIYAYLSAGCTLGFCPSPSPHTTACLENDEATYSCGGG